MRQSRFGPGLLFLFSVLTVAASGCAPGSGTQVAGQPASTASPKVLNIAVLRPIMELQRDVVGSAAGSGGADIFGIAHDQLVQQNGEALVPQLAIENISVEKGTWRANPDGTMDTTWQIHRNIKWHDGTPFTSADLLFTFDVYKDPDLPVKVGVAPTLWASAEAPDPYTFSVRWSSVFVDAIRAAGLYPMPRHLLEDSYKTDKAALINSPRWSTEFVGVGPYRVVDWDVGNRIEFVRFDEYWQGRPPLDRVIVRVIPDANSMVANVLAGEMDVILPTAVSIDAAAELQRRWDGSGNQVIMMPTGSVTLMDVQHRAEFARPRNGLRVVHVRQAFYHAIDRQTLTDVLNHGLAPIADSWVHPTDPRRPELEPSIPQFAYDPARARQLLTQAGWLERPDGVRVHDPSAERLEIEIRGEGVFERHATIIADNWRAIGSDVPINIIPAHLAGERIHRATAPAASITSSGNRGLYSTRMHPRNMPSEENRWTGSNYGGYQSPALTALLDETLVTLGESARRELDKEVLREQMGNVAVMPLHWKVEPVIAVRGITGIKDVAPWNMFEWDKR